MCDKSADFSGCAGLRLHECARQPLMSIAVARPIGRFCLLARTVGVTAAYTLAGGVGIPPMWAKRLARGPLQADVVESAGRRRAFVADQASLRRRRWHGQRLEIDAERQRRP